MDNHPTPPLIAPPLPDDAPSTPRIATCPMCHAAPPAVALAGDDWRCARCGQRWDAERLATVTAYAAWARERELMLVAAARPVPHLQMLPGGK